MDYPRQLEGVEAVEGGPLALWAPDRIVEEAEGLFQPNSRILDVGSGRGTNGTYLAMHEHEVISLEINPDYIENGRRIVKTLGGLALSNTFIEADMANLESIIKEEQFDAVIATRSLQEVDKTVSYDVVRKIQNGTKPGGLNIIRAYIATPEQQKIMSHRTLFEPGELQAIYRNSGWAELKYTYTLSPLVIIDDRPICRSTAELITKKLDEKEKLRQELLQTANYYARTDPEYHDLLVEQAGAL